MTGLKVISQTEFVEIDDMKSSYQHVPCGVPQGAILDPLRYLIYVNDIWKLCDSKIFSLLTTQHYVCLVQIWTICMIPLTMT